ncbi:MAG: hypothetical protein QXH30_02640 [Candidatus Bilamarchaeaceae archaeon]
MIWGAVGGIFSWIGQLLLLLGIYAYAAGGGPLLAALGFSMICTGEAAALYEKKESEEIALLRKRAVAEWAMGMAFPTLWLVFSLLGGGLLFLAFAASTGTAAIIRNVRIAAMISASC